MSLPLAGARTCWAVAVATHLAPLDSPQSPPPPFGSSGDFWRAFHLVSDVFLPPGVSGGRLARRPGEVKADPETLQVGAFWGLRLKSKVLKVKIKVQIKAFQKETNSFLWRKVETTNANKDSKTKQRMGCR